MTPTIVRPAPGVLTECVRTATAAPSLHNSQPWLFRLRPSGVDVYADPHRRLPVLDPDGRELLISVGAAVCTLRLALAGAGYRSAAALFPEPGDTDLVARVTVVQPAPVTRLTEQLVAAIPHRHTNRWPFARTPVPEAALNHLRDAARREGAALAVARPQARDAILALARSADQWLRNRPGYAEEAARWTGARYRGDGVPPAAAGPWDALEVVPVRDLAGPGAPPRPAGSFEPYPTILLLATAGDTPADRVHAGQALQRVLLTATWLDLATTPIGQPVEVPAVRRLLLDPETGLVTQMVLRVGYGRPVAGTPRRPLTEVLR